MKKLFAWFLVLAMCVSMFAGCGQEATPTTAPTQAPTQATEAPVVEDLSDPDGLAAALEYLQTIYKNAGGLTPKDFTRIGTIPVGTKRFEVVWTASVGEDLVKAVRGEDGMVTIDVNEECDTETPYTLTATITDAAGNSVSHTWEHALPAAMNVGDILDEAFALADGASLPYEVTLTGVITDIPELWSEQYKNLNVIMVMEGEEARPVLCYRLAGDGAKDLAIGDTITVTGTLTNYKGTIEFAQGCTLDNVISGGGEAPKPMEYTRFQPFPNGQKVVIYNLKSGMALSNKKTGYYNVGVKKSSFTAEEVWTAVLHSNGSYSFINNKGQALSLGKEYGSMNLDEKYDRWNIIKIEPGKFLIQNDGREENFMRWASQYKNWDTKAKTAPEKDVDFIIRFKLLDEDDVPEVEKPDTTMVPELVTDPKAGTAYKLYVEQGNVDKTLYFTGKTANTSYYLATTEDYKEAVDVFVEEVEGGSRLYFMDGEKKVYIDAFANGKYFNARLTAEPTAVFTYNSEYNTYVANLNGTDCYVGAYNTFETLSVSKFSYISTSFPAHLGTLKETVVIKELTVAEAIAMGSAMDSDTYTEEKYYVTGEITEVYNEKYGNMRIKDAEGNILTIYGTYSADGNTRYDALETKPVAGDTVKLLGVIGQYKGTPQMKNGWIVEHTPGAGGEEGGDNEGGETEEAVGVTITFDDKAKRTEFTTTKQVWTENGITVTNDKAASTNDVADYANPARFYKGSDLTVAFAGMTKIEFTCNSADYAAALQKTIGDAATVAGNAVTVILTEAADTYVVTNMSAQVRVNKITVYAAEAGGENGGETEETEAYKFGMIQGNLNDSIYYLAGGMNGFYMDTTTDYEKAIDVFMEETDGGCYFYTMDGATKLYINMVVSGTHVNGAYEDAASTVYTYDEDENTVVAVVNDKEYVFGTRNDKSYTTAGPITVESDGFVCKFYTENPNAGIEPPVSNDPAADTELTISEAIALGASKAHDTYTAGKYYVTGEITEVYQTTYGNMRIKDAEGNILTVYGTYSADGNTRYDAMETKPVAGDTVKVYGIIGQYNGTAQMKNAWIVEHTPAAGGEEGGESGGEVGENTTVSVKIASYASANGWANGTKYSELVMDDVVTATASTSGNNGKYYTSNTSWRFYRADNGTLTISAAGKTIVSVKITYSPSNDGYLVLDGATVSSNQTVAVNAPSATFSIGGGKDGKTNGQAHITAIEVIYG